MVFIDLEISSSPGEWGRDVSKLRIFWLRRKGFVICCTEVMFFFGDTQPKPGIVNFKRKSFSLCCHRTRTGLCRLLGGGGSFRVLRYTPLSHTLTPLTPLTLTNTLSPSLTPGTHYDTLTTLTLSRALSPAPHTLSQCHTLTPTLTHSLISPALTLSHASLTHAHFLTHSHTHFGSPALTLTITLTQPDCRTLSLSHTHTLTHTRTHMHAHTQM
jgi:hypothetical protein